MELVLVPLIACALSLGALWTSGKRRQRERLNEAAHEAKALVRKANIEAAALKRAVETKSRETNLDKQAEADAKREKKYQQLAKKEERLKRQAADQGETLGDLEQRQAELDSRYKQMRQVKDRTKGLRDDVQRRHEEFINLLEEKTGVQSADVCSHLSAKWIENVQAEAAHHLRSLEQNLASVHDNSAKRLMEIAVSRYNNHFLTERSNSKINLNPGILEVLTENENLVKIVLEKVSNINLLIADEGDFLRLEGLDGVGREVARRANQIGRAHV